MTLWDRVLSGFDLDDETVNFGTRIIAENNGSLYEAYTVATIQSREQVDQKPSVLPSIQHSKLFVAIDKSITIFQDETCNKVFLNANFRRMIACYCISKDGSFLFAVLTNRTLCCFHIFEKKLVSTISIPERDNQTNIPDNIINIFFKEQEEEPFVILVSNIGAIYRCFFKCDSKGTEITSSNSDKVAEHTVAMQCSQLFEGFAHLQFFDAAVDASSEELSIIMVGENSIFTWPNGQRNDFSGIFPFGYKKIKQLKNSSKMLCLRTDHVLSIMCPDTLLGLKVHDGPVFDFTIIQHDNVDHCEILFLSQSGDNDITYKLCLVSYPDFEQKLEIKVPITTYLFKNLNNSNNVSYMEGVAAESGVIDTFRIKTVAESIPDMRLARLLRRRQFDAAEAFAEKFSLSTEPIFCAKAAFFVEQLAPWTKSASDSVTIDALISILDNVQNVRYVTECCSKAFISDYMQLRQLYLYARRRIIQDMKRGNADDQFNTNLSLINDTLHRLETFQMIQDTESTEDTLLNVDATMSKWIKFSQVNLLDEFNMHLRMGQLTFATLIWTRHLPDITKHASVETLGNIFTILPEDMAPSCLWPWLTHFVPTVLSLLPDAMDEIVSWGLKKLKYLEVSHYKVWPEIGTDFGKKFLRLLKFEDNQQSVYFHQEYKYQNSLLKQFMFLLQALSDIQQLKITYRLKVPLNIYTKSPVEAVYMLLDKVHLHEISDLLANTFFKQYMLNNNLQNDSVLCKYIQKTIKDSSSWWLGEEAAWEKRVAVLIGFVYNLEKRLEQTLEVLKRAPIPWSSTINTLAETSSNFQHSLSSKIKIERDYVPIKLVLKKYGYATIGVNSKLISRIVKEDRDSMIDDMDVLVKNDEQLRRDAFCRCINVRLNEGCSIVTRNLEKAMDVIHYLEDNIADALYCYKGIVNYIIAAFSFQSTSLESLDCHIEILGWLKFKIHSVSSQSKVDPFFSNDIINTINDLQSLYLLRKNYKVDVSWESYRTQKSLVLQKCITQLLSSTEKNDLSAIHKTIVKIAALLGLEKLYTTLTLLKQAKDTDALKQFIDDDDKNPDVTPDEFENMHEICLHALKHATADTDTVEIVKNLSAPMLNTCRDSDLPAALSLYTCVHVYPNLSTQRYSDEKEGVAPKSNWKLYTVYQDQAISLDKTLLSLFKDAMSLQLCRSDRVDDNEVTDYDEQAVNFLLNARELQHQHNDYSLLQIFKTFYLAYCNTSSVKNENALVELKSTLSQLLLNLLRKLCTKRSFDLHLGLACLFMLPDQEAVNWITTTCASFEADHIRHSKILTLGYEYSRMSRNRTLMQNFDNDKLLHIWAQRLSCYSITYREFLTSDITGKREILQQIINNSKKNAIPILRDYCCSFGFNFSDCLLLYLQKLLKTWNPTTPPSMSKELVIRKEEVDALRRECEAVVAEMEDKLMLKEWISTSWQCINFYHYEVFVILMDLTGNGNRAKRNYLCFLQNYTRSGPPTTMERDIWMEFNSEHSALPPIAKWRLPFLWKVDFWKVVTPELNLLTYEKWLEIAPVLKLENHLICTLAIKGEMTLVWGNDCTKSKNVAWSLDPKNITLLKDIKKCIQPITNSERYYYGTAALYCVVKHTLPGADRVAAAKECYEYAQLAAQNSTQFEEGMLEKIKSMYLRFTSEHILRTYGLAKSKYFTLIENPNKLVRELYRDESIPSRYRNATNHRPDINAAVNELCELVSLNAVQLRLELLQEWLRSNPRYTALELSQSITETLPTLRSDQNTEYEDNLLRASYMLEGDMLFAQFLIHIGFDGSSSWCDADVKDDCDYDMRYRALRVLQTIVDTATLEKLTERDISSFRKYTKSLQYVGKLESLGLRYSIDTFETCLKRELVQILWKSHRYSPYALSVIAQICTEFEIHDILLWDGVLSQMAKLKMASELKRILLQGRSQSVIVNCNGYRMGWQLIISEPFSKMEVKSSTEQVDNCVEAIRLLHSCPIAHELDFSTIVRNCLQCEQPCLAVALLPFLNESDRKFALQIINEKCQIAELIEELNDLSSKGVLTIARSLVIVQNSVS